MISSRPGGSRGANAQGIELGWWWCWPRPPFPTPQVEAWSQWVASVATSSHGSCFPEQPWVVPKGQPTLWEGAWSLLGVTLHSSKGPPHHYKKRQAALQSAPGGSKKWLPWPLLWATRHTPKGYLPLLGGAGSPSKAYKGDTYWGTYPWRSTLSTSPPPRSPLIWWFILLTRGNYKYTLIKSFTGMKNRLLKKVL